MGGLITFLMAIWRTAKNDGKADWLEAFMCTGLALGIFSTLNFFKLPPELCVAIGTFVGYMGTHKVSRIISDKLNIEDDKK